MESNATFMNTAPTTEQDLRIVNALIDGFALMVIAVIDRTNFVASAVRTLFKKA
jgi:hypothetical protein